MKTKTEIRDETYKQIQHMIDFIEADQATDVLDMLAMMLQGYAETLAGACSVAQAAEGCRSIARYLEANPNLPAVHYNAKFH